MRICFICVGGFRHITPYLDYFKEAGHDVHFIALSPAPDYGVKTYNVGFGTKYSRTQGKWKYPLSMVRSRYLVRKIKPDIVHTHYVTSGGLAGAVCNFHPTITTVHGSDLNVGIHSRIWRPLLKAVFNQADCVNTCTEDQKRKVTTLGIPPEKIRVLTLGIDTDRFQFTERAEIASAKPLRLVTTRRLEKAYDHSTIVKQLAILHSEGFDFQMTFLANGSLAGELKQQVENQGLHSRVRFLGGVDKNRIAEILQNNHIFLSAPLWDGISVALLEAMATGLFPIVSDIDVNRDWIKEDTGGFRHGVGDAQDLARCIMKVRQNPELVMNVVGLNRAKVVELADTKKNMKVLEGVYTELIQQAHRGVNSRQ